MVNLIKLVIEEALSRNFTKVEDPISMYMTSAGMHAFNLVNRAYRNYFIGGSVDNMRLHICNCAPSGFSKSHWLSFFCGGKESIFKNTLFQTTMEGSINESTFAGSNIRDKEGNLQESLGIAKTHTTSIIAFEEIHGVLESMQRQVFNTNFQDQFLNGLDSGRVKKRQGGGVIDFVTNFTCWMASQPTRLNLGDGLFRRFMFNLECPVESDFDNLRDSIRSQRGVRSNYGDLKSLRNAIDDRFTEITNVVKNIEYTSEFEELKNKMDFPPYEENIYDRMGIGYNIMSQEELEETLVVKVDDTLRNMISKQYDDRKKINRDPLIAVVWNYLADAETLDLKFFEDRMVDFFQFPMDKVTKAKKKLREMGFIEERGDSISIKKKATDMDVLNYRKTEKK